MYRRILSLLLFSVVVIAASCTNNQRGNETKKIPDEAQALVEACMDTQKLGVHESIKYMHFEDDWTENVYLESKNKLLDYTIENTEIVNDKLIALTIQVRSMVSDETGRTQGEGTYETVYNFAAMIEGEWRFINGVRHIPAELKDNFDESKYSYSDTNIVAPSDVLLPEGLDTYTINEF